MHVMSVAALTCPALPYLAPRGPPPCQFRTIVKWHSALCVLLTGLTSHT